MLSFFYTTFLKCYIQGNICILSLGNKWSTYCTGLKINEIFENVIVDYFVKKNIAILIPIYKWLTWPCHVILATLWPVWNKWLKIHNNGTNIGCRGGTNKSIKKPFVSKIYP